jgi:hypothetical protein
MTGRPEERDRKKVSQHLENTSRHNCNVRRFFAPAFAGAQGLRVSKP